MIPFKTKHDEAQYVKVVFNVNWKHQINLKFKNL